MTDDVIEADAPEIPQYPDGVYLHLPEEHYHAQERMSLSGINWMIASEGDFWANSWMNPDRDDAPTPAQLLGRAFHMARLEPEKLGQRFVRQIEPEDFGDNLLKTDVDVRAAIKAMQPQKEDYPDALRTDADVKRALKDLGQPQSQGAETPEDRRARLRSHSSNVIFWDDIVADWEAEHGPMSGPEGEAALDRAQRLRSYGYEGPIWALEQDEFERVRAGREALPAKFWDQVMADIDAMQTSPIAARYLTGGRAEVSILWTDTSIPGHPVKMKSRLDHMAPARFTDVKTFDNPQRKPVRQCIRDQFRFNRYYVQAVVYREAAETARSGGLNLMDSTGAEDDAFFRSLIECSDPMRCTYVFQQKGGVPNVLATHIRFGRHHASFEAAEIGVSEETAENVKAMYAQPSLFVRRAENEVVTALRTFVACMEKYGPGRKWYPLDPEFEISDDSFPPYFLEEF